MRPSQPYSHTPIFRYSLSSGLFCFFLLRASLSFAQEPLIVFGKFRIEHGDLAGAKIELEQNGKVVRSVFPQNTRFEFKLAYGYQYIFIFSKKGYVTKKISFDTDVPSLRLLEPVEPFGFDVTLFKQYEGVNIVVFNQPVGRIAYSKEKDDFDYDTDYTKSIRSAIEQAEKELQEKYEEEEGGSERGDEKKKAAEEAGKRREEMEKRWAEEVARKKAEEDERRRIQAEERQRRRAEAQAAADEERRKKAEAKSQAELERVQANLAAKQAREERAKALAQRLEELRRRMTEPQRGEGHEERKEAQAGLGEESRAPSPLAEKYSQGVTEETLSEEGKKIIRRIVVKGKSADEYKMIIFSWGGVYFKKNGTDISQAVFDAETRP